MDQQTNANHGVRRSLNGMACGVVEAAGARAGWWLRVTQRRHGPWSLRGGALDMDACLSYPSLYTYGRTYRYCLVAFCWPSRGSTALHGRSRPSLAPVPSHITRTVPGCTCRIPGSLCASRRHCQRIHAADDRKRYIERKKAINGAIWLLCTQGPQQDRSIHPSISSFYAAGRCVSPAVTGHWIV